MLSLTPVSSSPQLPRKLAYFETIYVDGTPSIIYNKNPVMTP